jgi:hypothetical protein
LFFGALFVVGQYLFHVTGGEQASPTILGVSALQ